MKYLIFLFILTQPVQIFNAANARRGCCSGHNGVCGCTCCDGSSLSAKCSQYYPACNKSGSETNLNHNKLKEIQLKLKELVL